MKKIQNKIKIIKSAIGTFAYKGYHGATMSDISKSAGMTPGNMYHYFRSKKEIAKEAISYVMNILGDIITEINKNNIPPKEKIYKFIKQYQNLQKTDPELIKFFFRIYLAHEEIFCENNENCFEFGVELMDGVAQMIFVDYTPNEDSSDKAKISFSILFGILGGVSFMNSQKFSDVLSDEHLADELSSTIYKALI